MDQKLKQLFQMFPQGVAPGTGPLMMANNEYMPPEEPAELQMPPMMKSVQAQSPMQQPAKYTDQFEDEFKNSMSERQQQIQALQEKLGETQGKEIGFLEGANLRPALAFADSLTGGNSVAYYQPPTAQAQKKSDIQRLEEAIAKQQGALSDDQLGYLKQRSSEENMMRREAMADKRMAAMGSKANDQAEDKLRAQYLANPLYKGMAEISKAYESIANNPADNGPAQQAMVYQFSRILDPGSVVRETEYAMSAGNAGKISQAQNYLQKLQSGQMLTREQVALMKEVASNLVKSARMSLDNHNRTYSELAQRRGVNPQNVVIDAFQGTQASRPSGGIMSPQEWLKQNSGGR